MKKLLDCTLRDGGYINDWRFGENNIKNILMHLAAAGVDFAELGFIDENIAREDGRSIVPRFVSFDEMAKDVDLGVTKLIGMIDFGTCEIDSIPKAEDSCLDCIRVIFKKHDRKKALDFCNSIKEKGYDVFVQPVSVTSYTEEELRDLITRANEIEPYVVSLVDTYGLLHQGELMEYFDKFDRMLKESIGIGYHGHNNFQMAYANCISILEKQTKRELVVDGSLYGMGKSAGNSPTELIAAYMNQKQAKNYDVIELLEAIDESILTFQSNATWGYSLLFFLAAYCGCHPNYAKYFKEEKALPMKKTYEILAALQEDKKLSFDKDYAESIYRDR